jgi:hypothetical protein
MSSFASSKFFTTLHSLTEARAKRQDPSRVVPKLLACSLLIAVLAYHSSIVKVRFFAPSPFRGGKDEYNTLEKLCQGF